MTDAWLARAIATFNHPSEMGERPEDAVVELDELLASPPPEATSAERALVAVLRAEAGASLAASYGDGTGPYVTARLRAGELELFHGPRQEWIRWALRDARRGYRVERASSDGALCWAAFDPRGPEIEARFAEHAGEGTRLVDLARRLAEEGEHAVVEDIATTVLREGAMFPGHWWALLAEVGLARGDLAEARAAIARGLLYVSTYDPQAFAQMVRWLEAAGADVETVAVVYAAVTGWSYPLGTNQHLGWRPGPKPKQLKSRFGVIYAEWVREVWPGLDGFTPGEILHLRALFGELAARPLADLRREIDGWIEAFHQRAVPND